MSGVRSWWSKNLRIRSEMCCFQRLKSAIQRAMHRPWTADPGLHERREQGGTCSGS